MTISKNEVKKALLEGKCISAFFHGNQNPITYKLYGSDLVFINQEKKIFASNNTPDNLHIYLTKDSERIIIDDKEREYFINEILSQKELESI